MAVPGGISAGPGGPAERALLPNAKGWPIDGDRAVQVNSWLVDERRPLRPADAICFSRMPPEPQYVGDPPRWLWFRESAGVARFRISSPSLGQDATDAREQGGAPFSQGWVCVFGFLEPRA